MKLNILVYILFLISIACAEKRSYEGYSLFKITPKTENDLIVLKHLQRNGLGEFWEDEFYKNYGHRVMVSRENRIVFNDVLEKSGIVAEELIKDLQGAIEEQLRPAERSAQGNHSFLSMNWNQYYSLDDIYSWLDRVEQAYPSIVTPVVMGTTFENRTIRGIKINYRPNRNDTVIGMLQGALHSYEWITTATITWIIKEFLTSTNADVRAFAENIEWHLFPVINPDGYVYTFTWDRMWRKNRNIRNFTSCAASGVRDDMSNGVDLNRNFDHVWMTIGASDDPCSIMYAGPEPFSEPESRAIAQYVQNLNNQGNLLYYVDFHSFAQLFCIPYSHINSTDVLQVEHYADMYEIAVRSAKKLGNRFGTEYLVGLPIEVLYPMSGTNFDWVKYAVGVPLTYIIELRDRGEYGYLLPPEQIVPNNLEIMDALLEMDKTARMLGYYTYSSSRTILSSFGIILFGLLVALIAQ